MFDFGFIGCGHMASEIIRAVAANGNYSIAVCNRTREKAQKLASETGACVLDAKEICEKCRYIVIGVRPQDIGTLSEEISEALKARSERFVMVTMLAGKSIGKTKSAFGRDMPVIRIMPNTPIAVGKGVILFSAEGTTDNEIKIFTDSLSACGSVVPVDESVIDAGCVVSGSGPAYVYKFISAFAKAGVSIGFDEQTALKLVCETVAGAAEMVLKTHKSADELCSEVCSKGGSTEQGIIKIDSSDFNDIIESAAKASYARTLEMGK